MLAMGTHSRSSLRTEGLGLFAAVAKESLGSSEMDVMAVVVTSVVGMRAEVARRQSLQWSITTKGTRASPTSASGVRRPVRVHRTVLEWRDSDAIAYSAIVAAAVDSDGFLRERQDSDGKNKQERFLVGVLKPKADFRREG